MSDLASLRPTELRRVIDLVREAGIDVSDWANFAGGKTRAATNPRYCYEWAFAEAGKVVALNIWYRDILAHGQRLILKANLRASAERHARGGPIASSVWQKRAARFDRVVALAALQGLPVRAIICDGTMRRATEGASQVKVRSLDPVPWSVTSYDVQTGAFTLARGALPNRLVDQFSEGAELETPTEMKPLSGSAFVRNPHVRSTVLSYAAGTCEWCGQPGFTTPAGEMFLETHHVVPLAEGGADIVANVVALCPNHHREAHFGSAQAVMRDRLLVIARQHGARARAV